VPVVRLFAQAREALGASSVELDGATVDEVLRSLRHHRSDGAGGLAGVLDVSRVYLNGEPAEGHEPVAAQDEVAVVPPVSGG